MGPLERQFLLEAFDSNWIAPLGPQVDAFEAEFAAAARVPYAVALSSGTAALHLALIGLPVKPGDVVLTSTLTFAATVNAIRYVGAEPAFVDVSRATWTLDPDLIEEELSSRAATGSVPAAIIAVDLYGQCADYHRLVEICARYGVPIIVDAAESLGSTYQGQPPGQFGRCAAYSFNGNKIITTSGGGMLVSADRKLIDHARYLSTQARQPAPHYEHLDVGYNYRLSNLLAAVGRAQLMGLPAKLARRREINQRYREALGVVPGFSVMPEAPYGRSNCWLTCVLIDPAGGITSEKLRLQLEAENIEARPVWKPMHQQPVFAQCGMRGGAVAAELFAHGLCLPSGSSLTPDDQERVIAAVMAPCRL